MHNRDLVWKTKEGKKVKIRNMSSLHLVNLSNFIDKKILVLNKRYGVNKTNTFKHAILQEIRLRKLNILKISQNEQELF